jgi:hypothetical protein
MHLYVALAVKEPGARPDDWAGRSQRGQTLHSSKKAQGPSLGNSADVIFIAEDPAAAAPEKERSEASIHGRAADERWHQRKTKGSSRSNVGSIVWSRRPRSAERLV